MEELKIVHREETQNDWMIQEIARTKAACICRLQFKRCSKDSCNNCASYKRYKNVVAGLSEYDKYRLDHYVSQAYTQYSLKPAFWLPHKKLIARTLWYAIVVTAFIGIICLMASCKKAAPPKDRAVFYVTEEDVYKYPEVKQCIATAMDAVVIAREIVWDITGDGEVNCQDKCFLTYRILKKIWGDLFYDIKIVWNHNNPNSSMNHVFIEVWFSENIVAEIETTCLDPSFDCIFVKDIWGKTYDRRYNTYDVWKWYKQTNMGDF